MLRDTIFTIIISIIFIFIIHFLYEYFKKNLTTPKVKDLISKPNNEYKKIYDILNNEKKINQSIDITKNNEINNVKNNNAKNNNNINNSPNLNNLDKELIKDELKNFFSDLNVSNDTNRQDNNYCNF